MKHLNVHIHHTLHLCNFPVRHSSFFAPDLFNALIVAVLYTKNVSIRAVFLKPLTHMQKKLFLIRNTHTHNNPLKDIKA